MALEPNGNGYDGMMRSGHVGSGQARSGQVGQAGSGHVRSGQVGSGPFEIVADCQSRRRNRMWGFETVMRAASGDIWVLL